MFATVKQCFRLLTISTLFLATITLFSLRQFIILPTASNKFRPIKRLRVSNRSYPQISTLQQRQCTLIRDQQKDSASEFLNQMDDFGDLICPQQFRNLADWVYGWHGWDYGENIHTASHTEIIDCIPEGAIIYVTAWHIDEFFRDVYPQIRHPFVLITGASTISVPQPQHAKYLTSKRSKIIHWFGQNGAHFTNRQAGRFTHIPVGLNCHKHAKAIFEIIGGVKANDINFQSPAEAFSAAESPPQKLLLINFTPTNDPTGERDAVLKRFCCNNCRLNYTLCIHKDDGVEKYVRRLPQIYRRNRIVPFWVSPRGAGLDCHRTWEAMMLGRIPIVKRSNISVLYDQLPVWQVASWDELDDLAAVRRKLKELIENWDRFDLRKLRFSYWKRLILSKSAYKNLSRDEDRPPRYWQLMESGFWGKLSQALFINKR